MTNKRFLNKWIATFLHGWLIGNGIGLIMLDRPIIGASVILCAVLLWFNRMLNQHWMNQDKTNLPYSIPHEKQ